MQIRGDFSTLNVVAILCDNPPMADFSPLDWFWVAAFLLLMVGGAGLFVRLARLS